MTRTANLCVVAAALLAMGVAGATADEVRQSDHWSFQPLVRPDIPTVQDAEWPRNDVDRFTLAALESRDLRPLPEADRATLLRRATFDLTGLPPTPEEIDAFLGDPRDGAFERVVDRLLDSRAYAERWTQHWLDLARYAETDGFEHDHVRPQAWRYRDWVIDALDADMPYQEFIRLQLAGDELRPGDQDAAIATGFVLCGPDMPDINLVEERRHMVLNEATGAIGAVLLGLQIGCAQCHDHKFDPLSIEDFYALRAVFEPGLHFKHEEVRALSESSAEAAASFVRVRGDFRRTGAEVTPAVPAVLSSSDPRWASSPDGATTGRRAALAAWLTQEDHPLTWRVIVNRLWQHHFGRGLVATPSDFGVMGAPPTHPELLDWLAAEIVRQGGSLKSLHRLMVTSATYRTASRPDSPSWTYDEREEAKAVWQAALEADPSNDLLARQRRVRLEGEAIRDAMLAVSGTLSEATGGPGAAPPLPDELVSTLLKGQWKASPDEDDHRRRSIYLFARRNLRFPFFETFDRPSADATCPRRDVSTTALQSLMLLNSEFSNDAARALAARLRDEANETPQQVERAYLLTFGRMPSPEEAAEAEAFLNAEGLATDSLEHFCLALFNANEFVYID